MPIVDNFLSVVMPVYNRSRYLVEAIESVLSQRYQEFELIIVDDGSTNHDVTDIFKKYEGDSRVRIYRLDSNQGQSAAINFAVNKARGQYFCRLDSDDKLLENALEVCSRYINQYSQVSYFYSSRYVIDQNSLIDKSEHNHPEGIHESRVFDKELLKEKYHCNHLICLKKDDFIAAGGMDENILWAEDWELAIRMSEKYMFQNMDEALYMFRQTSMGSITSRLSVQQKDRFTEIFLAEKIDA